MLEKRGTDYYAYGVLAGLFHFVAAIIIFLLIDFSTLDYFTLLIAIFSGVIYGASAWIYYHLMTYSEASQVIGVAYIFPIFVVIFSSIFLHEKLSIIQYAAILLAVSGTFFIAAEKHKYKWKLSHAFWLMIFFAILMGIVDVADKYVVDAFSFWETFVRITIPQSIILMLPFFRKKVRNNIPKILPSTHLIAIAEGLGIVGVLGFLKGASLTKISLVSAMGTLQPVFVFLFGLILSLFLPKLLKESITARVIICKIIGLGCIVVAAIVLGG